MARKEELKPFMNRTTQLEWLHLTTTLFPPKEMFIFHHIPDILFSYKNGYTIFHHS